MRGLIVNRDQLTYGREFDIKAIFYISMAIAARFTISKVDAIVRQSAGGDAESCSGGKGAEEGAAEKEKTE